MIGSIRVCASKTVAKRPDEYAICLVVKNYFPPLKLNLNRNGDFRDYVEHFHNLPLQLDLITFPLTKLRGWQMNSVYGLTLRE